MQPPVIAAIITGSCTLFIGIITIIINVRATKRKKTEGENKPRPEDIGPKSSAGPNLIHGGIGTARRGGNPAETASYYLDKALVHRQQGKYGKALA